MLRKGIGRETDFAQRTASLPIIPPIYTLHRAATPPRATDMSFFDLSGRTNAGEAVDFATHKGKCVLVVNVARL